MSREPVSASSAIGLVPGAMPEPLPVRPTGAWAVAGFLVFAILTMWTLVAVLFVARS